MKPKNVSKPQGTSKKLKVSSIGDLTRQLLVLPINPDAPKEDQVRLSNSEIAQKVSEVFPNRKANGPNECVAWYASKLRKDAKYRDKYTNGMMPLPARDAARQVEIEVPLD